MRIAIDMQTTLGQKTGIGFYVQNLVRSLEAIDDTNTYVKILPKSQEDFRSLERFWWDQVEVPRRARRAKADLLHQPGFSAPLRASQPVIVTVHDLIAIHFGHDIPFGSRLYFGRWMPFSYRYAHHIIAVSNHTKQDLVEHLGIPAKKISVVYSAANRAFRPIRDRHQLAKVRSRFGLADRFVLHVGTINPRKNLEFLVRVFATVCKRLKSPLMLAIVGKRGWYDDELFELVRRYHLRDSVVFTDYVTEPEKVALMNAASLLAFPSLYEGFGLPPLEAMQCGTPVIASNTSSIPEVVGDGGRLVDPTNEAGWVEAMEAVLTDRALARQLATAGRTQAQQFSWSRCARETKAVYERARA